MEDAQKTNTLIYIAISVASVMGAGAFGLLFSGAFQEAADIANPTPAEDAHVVELISKIDFLPLEPIMISLGSTSSGRQLRFEGYLEIESQRREEVTYNMPRIIDALNTYLRAIKVSDLDEPSSLLKIRLQMLKRVQLITSEDLVKDLLVSKFLVN